MFHAIERAAEKLADPRAEVDLDPEVTLALVPKGEGLELGVARPAPQDQVIEREGDPILVVSPQVADRLDGWMLDVRAAGGAGGSLRPELERSRPEGRLAPPATVAADGC